MGDQKMDLENLNVGKVVMDKFTDNLLTIKEISKTPDQKDTYVRGNLVNDPKSEIQTRHINDIEEF